MNIATSKILNRIESLFHKSLKKDSYAISKVKAKSFLMWNRFDLAFKLLFLDLISKNKKKAKEVYLEHIKAFTLNKFIEPGNPKKNSPQSFIDIFNSTYESIKNDGFSYNKSIIPISKNKTIINGSHRVASSIHLKKSLFCLEIEEKEPVYDHQFFSQRKVPIDLLDEAALKFINYADNIYMALLWPSSKSSKKDQINFFPNAVYVKNIKLNINGFNNLISQIYFKEEWLGDKRNNYIGLKNKAIKCFKKNSLLRIILFQCESISSVNILKRNVRKFYGIGKHSIHITDKKEEVIRNSQILLNKNSIHFLNHARDFKFIEYYNLIEVIKLQLKYKKIENDDFILTGSTILSLYGLRRNQDFDFLCSSNKKIFNDKKFNNHKKQLKFYSNGLEDLLYDPKNFFFFNGLKILSFKNIYSMKLARSETKDIYDYKMMRAFLDHDTFSHKFYLLIQYLLYIKVYLSSFVYNLLNFFGFVPIIKKIIIFFKNKK